MFEMSIRVLVSRFVQNGQAFLRGVKHFNELLPSNKVALCKPKLNILPQEPRVGYSTSTSSRVSTVQSVASQVQLHARRIFVDNVLRRVTNSLTADLRRRTTKRILFGDSAPFFALVGVSLASGTGILTKDEELEGICWEIREAVAKMQWSTFASSEEDSFYEDQPVGLNAFDWGSVIAKGCNAVVYAACKRREIESTHEAATMDAQPAAARHEEFEESLPHPLAIKMMFNYDAESNAAAILRTMYRETIPAHVRSVDEEFSNMENRLAGAKVVLPPHPNIVKMYCVFTDYVPSLPDSLSLYPHALPARINPDGYGRNMSLFLVMKRYDCSLKQYLQDQDVSPRTSTLLLAQLLEGVLHMNMHRIAHRDLKCDNILLDVSEGDEVCPLLTITDFGCSLANRDHGLMMPYHSPDTDRGGNTALMAPEVVCATPGAFASINYSKADVWAVGAIAYEMFGMSNPFYSTKDTGKPLLYSYRYQDSELLKLPDSVPPLVQSVVMGVLKRNPSQRLSADTAATILQLHLWAPSAWLQTQGHIPATNEILQWLLCLTTKVLCESRNVPQGDWLRSGNKGGRRTLPEYQLIATFLCRVSLRSIKEAIKWIHSLQ